MKFITLKTLSIICLLTVLLSCSKDELNNPPVIENQEFTISEGNLLVGVGTVLASDVNNNTLEFSIISQSIPNAISINSESGKILINDTRAFDFEVNQQLTALVQVSDGELTAQATITINITDEIDQAPVIANQTFSINENPSIATILGTVIASDPQNLALKYALVSHNTNNNSTTIDENSGELTVNLPEDFNFEVNPIISAIVNVSNGTLSSEAKITITINNISPPTNGLIAHYQMNDNSGTAALDSSGGNNHANFDTTTNIHTVTPPLVTGFDGRENHAFDMFLNSKPTKFYHNASSTISGTKITIASHFKYISKLDTRLIVNGNFSFKIIPNSNSDTMNFSVNIPEGPNRTIKRLSKSIQVVENQWYHFAITQSGEDWNLYINGNLSNSTTALGPFFQFGAGGSDLIEINDRFQALKGHLDNFTIYNRALSAAEIKLISKEEN